MTIKVVKKLAASKSKGKKTKKKAVVAENNSVSSKNGTLSNKYVCPICHKKYLKAQALGGHMSKAHPHMSDQYQYKQQRRNERLGER